MKISDLLVMKGPSIWSAKQHKLIIIKVENTSPGEDAPLKINELHPSLADLLHAAHTHHCEQCRKTTTLSLKDQTITAAHLLQHIAIEVQQQAGLAVKFGNTREGKNAQTHFVLIEYQYEKAGIKAARAAAELLQSNLTGAEFDSRTIVNEIKTIAARESAGPSTRAIMEEARIRHIPCRRMGNSSLLLLGQGQKQRKMRATVAGSTFGIGMEIARDKQETKDLLAASYIPVPKGVLLYAEDEIEQALQTLPFPLVIKPLNGNHGRGITSNLNDLAETRLAFRNASKISLPVIMEEHIKGEDYRLVLVNYKLVAAAKRSSARVTGDGKSTVQELIDKVNSDPARGSGHDNYLTSITLDEQAQSILAEKDKTPQDILAKDEVLILKHTANISTGGTAEDVTDEVHAFNVLLAERISRIVGLDICGIDILATDISKPLTGSNGAVIEVNAGPGLRMHLEPSKGLARNIAKPIIEMLFPAKEDGRIPLVAVTGTNGKTTTTRLTAFIAQHAGKHSVGYTTTDGIYLNGVNIHQGDCTGPRSTELLLSEPMVDFAVLECARGGILRSGLAFDECDISIVTNVSADHLGLKGIDTLEEMAGVKAVVPKSTRAGGYAILNADDDLVYAMKDALSCNIALFSMYPDNERITSHCANGGMAAVAEDGYITVLQGKWKTRVEKITAIPLTLDGRAESMVKNVMPAVLVATIRNFDLQAIKKALVMFVPSPEQTPGRMNIFDFGEKKLMVDYAHNLDGMKELKKFLERTPASLKVGIIGIAGDRRDEDIFSFGKMSAGMFDEIIIRHDEDMRGRSKEEMTALLNKGIREIRPEMRVQVISEEIAAISHALNEAPPEAFITVCTEKVTDTLNFVLREHDRNQKIFSKN